MMEKELPVLGSAHTFMEYGRHFCDDSYANFVIDGDESDCSAVMGVDKA